MSEFGLVFGIGIGIGFGREELGALERRGSWYGGWWKAFSDR